MSERKKSKPWKATVRGKQDTIVVRLAYLLRECDQWQRKTVTSRAFQFNGDDAPSWP